MTFILIWVQIFHLPLGLLVQQLTIHLLGIHFYIIFVPLLPYIYCVPFCVIIMFRYLCVFFSPRCFLLLILFHLLLQFFCVIVCSLFLVPSLFYFCIYLLFLYPLFVHRHSLYFFFFKHYSVFSLFYFPFFPFLISRYPFFLFC